MPARTVTLNNPAPSCDVPVFRPKAFSSKQLLLSDTVNVFCLIASSKSSAHLLYSRNCSRTTTAPQPLETSVCSLCISAIKLLIPFLHVFAQSASHCGHPAQQYSSWAEQQQQRGRRWANCCGSRRPCPAPAMNSNSLSEVRLWSNSKEREKYENLAGALQKC
jgi:hypothetical protein